jgi:hypothetical protein
MTESDRRVEEKTLMMIVGQEGGDRSGGIGGWASKVIGGLAGVARGREGRGRREEGKGKGEEGGGRREEKGGKNKSEMGEMSPGHARSGERDRRV